MSLPPPPASGSPISYPAHAHCHCRATRFTITRAPAPALPPNSCNCSICVKNGYLLVYPRRADVVFEAGEAALREYRFASGRYPHMFCGTCGSSVLVEEGDFWGVNVRMIEGLEVEGLEVEKSDGKRELNPEYKN